jgi:hypothetical protein
MSPNAKRGGGGCGASANEYIGAQINFRDLAPYLTYGGELCDLWVNMHSNLLAELGILKYFFRIRNPELRIRIRKASLLCIRLDPDPT